MWIQFSLLALMCVSTASAFTCPEDVHSFYHADVSSGCTEYHLCENGQLQTLTCPSGQAFNHAASQCEDASAVSCVETMDHHMHHHHSEHEMHHHHKRAVETYHTISIQAIKSKVVQLYKDIRPLVASAVKEVAPSMYYTFEADYLPIIKSVHKEAMPVFYEKVLPRVESFLQYSTRLAGRLIEKAYKSYELSNSTHITVVSLSDVANDITNDLQPVIELGRYLSARLLQPTRAKRSAPQPKPGQVPALLQGFVEPIVKNVFSSVGATFYGQEDTLTSKLILPIIYEMMEDDETRFDMMKCYYSAKSSFLPVISEMLSKQTYDTPAGTVIHIPRSVFDAAKKKFYTETKPMIRKIAGKHLSMILRRSSENARLILKTVDLMEESKKHHKGVMNDAILNFVTKHGSLLQTSNSKYVNTYTLTEIQKDLRPIYVTLLQICFDYFSKNQDSWISIFFNRDSYIYKTILGSPEYATQINSRSPKPVVTRLPKPVVVTAPKVKVVVAKPSYRRG